MNIPKKKVIAIGIAVVVLGGAYALWQHLQQPDIPPGLASGNGRIEATEIYVSTKLGGRVEDILVQEGDYVEAGQLLATMNTDVLQAQLLQAQAQYKQMLSTQLKAEAQVTLRESDKDTAQAQVQQRLSEQDAANRRFQRTSTLTRQGALSRQEFDNDETTLSGARAAVVAARSQVTVADAAIEAARADVEGAVYNVRAAEAAISRIQADIDDSYLTAPVMGRIQYRVAQPGEVLAAGGRILNLIDMSDVYMTFFLPEEEAGQIGLGSEARIILDAASERPIPASISYVASSAQFTPKTVETRDERQKLMFRIKAQVPPQVLEQYSDYVKVGLPGVAWVKTDPQAEWPETFPDVQ